MDNIDVTYKLYHHLNIYRNIWIEPCQLRLHVRFHPRVPRYLKMEPLGVIGLQGIVNIYEFKPSLF